MEQGLKKGYEDAFEPARKDGYDKGYVEAFDNVKNRFEQHIHEPLEDLKNILGYFDQYKKELLWEAEQSFVLLAVKLAEKIVQRNIEISPEMVKNTVASALETVSQTTNISIRVSPDDISIIEELKGELEYVLGRFDSVRFQPDVNIQRGGCLVLTERGKVDAQIEVQLERIARDILETNSSLNIGDEDLQQRIKQAALSADATIDTGEQGDIESQNLVDDIDDPVKEQTNERISESENNIIEEPGLQVSQEVEPQVSQADGMDMTDKSQNTVSQPEPKIDQAAELRKQMKDNIESDNQE